MPVASKFLLYILILVLNALLFSCSSDEPIGPSISEIPQYPNSEKGKSMQQTMFGMGGSIQQYSTDDDFKRVLSYYETELAQYTPEVITHDLDDGRQSALTIKKENGAITIAIQEHKDNEKVMITVMEVSK